MFLGFFFIRMCIVNLQETNIYQNILYSTKSFEKLHNFHLNLQGLHIIILFVFSWDDDFNTTKGTISVLANSLLLIILLYIISFFSTDQVYQPSCITHCLLVVCKLYFMPFSTSSLLF